MSEDKKSDLGAIQVHKKVLAEIIYNAICEIDGVSLIQPHLIGKVAQLLGRKNYPGIEIKGLDDEPSLEIKVLIRYGLNIPRVAQEIQNAVKQAVERTAEISLSDINVNVQGVERRS